MDFCRDKGYKRVFLWTFDELHAAIHLYRSFGFEKTRTKTHLRWGGNLTEERYELDFVGGRYRLWHKNRKTGDGI